MIRPELPKDDGQGNIFMYCAHCGHEQKEPLTKVTPCTIVECEECGRVACASGWLYAPLPTKEVR
jgi:uncharacterized Zn finger protein